MKYKITLLCSLLISYFGIAQNRVHQLEQYFSLLEKNDQFNGTALVAENGKIIFEKVLGKADFSTNEGISLNTVFPLASISKTITATAVLQLVQAGKLNVTDAVTDLLPQFPYKQITIEHLLSHTSGLPPYNTYFAAYKKEKPDTVFSNKDMLAGMLANPAPLIYTPGSSGNYDNVNYIILALIIEKLSGMPYEAYIKKHILDPAGMKNTRFLPLRLQYIGPAQKHFAYPYLFPHRYSDDKIRAKEVAYVADYWSSYNFSGFGEYVSTVQDLLKYDKALYGESLIKNDILKRSLIPVQLSNGKDNAQRFGWGWQVYRDSTNGKVAYHNGNATGHSCILLRNITKRQTIIIFDNIHGNNSQDLAFKVLSIINGDKVPFPKKSITDLYTRSLIKDGAGPAKEMLMRLKNDTVNYYLSEDEMNLAGYDFMGGPNNPNPYHFKEERKIAEALETFRMNTELFPASWNVYDSYGEALLEAGKKDIALQMYKKSVELNPGNTAGKKIIESLQQQ